MTRRTLILAAAGGSAALLLGAFGFQALGYVPCKLCIWQRWPHAVAIAIGLVALIPPALAATGRALPLLGALAALVASGIGVYHTGIERGWWTGPTACTSGPVGGQSAEQLLDQIMNAPLIRCDEVAWSLLGLSMASWNALLSLILAFVWIAAARRAA